MIPCSWVKGFRVKGSGSVVQTGDPNEAPSSPLPEGQMAPIGPQAEAAPKIFMKEVEIADCIRRMHIHLLKKTHMKTMPEALGKKQKGYHAECKSDSKVMFNRFKYLYKTFGEQKANEVLEGVKAKYERVNFDYKIHLTQWMRFCDA